MAFHIGTRTYLGRMCWQLQVDESLESMEGLWIVLMSVTLSLAHVSAGRGLANALQARQLRSRLGKCMPTGDACLREMHAYERCMPHERCMPTRNACLREMQRPRRPCLR